MEYKNCEIMSRDTVVARWINGVLNVDREDLLPLYLKRVASADEWLKSRAIDGHRTNSRLIKRALRLAQDNDLNTVWYAHGATITDSYWVRDIGSDLKYNDVSFKDNAFAELALHGTHFANAADSKNKHTPELTNTGSFEKCWIQKNGKWFMIKKASEREAFSEVFVSKLCKSLGIDAAIYEPDTNGVITKDFTENATVNFEPVSSFISEEEYIGDYEELFDGITTICPDAAQSFVNMIFVDAVCYNVDRHLANLGVLRDPDNGTVLKMAPLFDHNMALIAYDFPEIGRDDMLLRDFRKFIRNHPEYAGTIPEISSEIIRDIIQDVPYDVDAEYIENLILSRQELAWDFGRDSRQELDI